MAISSEKLTFTGADGAELAASEDEKAPPLVKGLDHPPGQLGEGFGLGQKTVFDYFLVFADRFGDFILGHGCSTSWKKLEEIIGCAPLSVKDSVDLSPFDPLKENN